MKYSGGGKGFLPPSEEDLLACIKYLCDEGFITVYQDENDEWFVKIAENV
jgi:DNA-binding PadR family transcriptional regulator